MKRDAILIASDAVAMIDALDLFAAGLVDALVYRRSNGQFVSLFVANAPAKLKRSVAAIVAELELGVTLGGKRGQS